MFLNIFLCSLVVVAMSATDINPVQTYPIYQLNGNINRPSNINTDFYYPGNTAQNQLTHLNISPSSIKQVILNKLLEDFDLQRNLNRGSTNYGLNLSDLYNNYMTDNLGRDNLIVTKENRKVRSDNSNDVPLNVLKSKEQLPRSNKKKSKRKRLKNVDENSEITIGSNTQGQDNDNTIEKDLENKRNSKDITQTDNAKKNSNRKSTTNRKRKKKGPKLEDSEDSKSVNKGVNPRRRKNKTNSKLEHIVNNTKEFNLNNKTVDIARDKMDTEHRKTKNLTLEQNEVVRTVNNIPQEIPQNIFPNSNLMSNPMMSNWFSTYENLFKSMQSNNQTNANVETKSTRKTNKKRNRKNKKNNIVVNGNSTLETSTPKILQKELTSDDINLKPLVENFKTFDTDKKWDNIIEDRHSSTESEDILDRGYFDEYINDYYPIFTDNGPHTANDPTVLKNLNDSRYFYTTEYHLDTNIEQYGDNSNDNDQNSKIYKEIEDKIIKNILNEKQQNNEIENTNFGSPPFLETPDFKTRAIDKNEIKSDNYDLNDNLNRYVGEKSFKAKTANFSGDKKHGNKPQTKDIETVYAKSKVVTYGPVYTAEDDTSPEMQSPESLVNNGPIYVLPESLNYQDY